MKSKVIWRAQSLVRLPPVWMSLSVKLSGGLVGSRERKSPPAAVAKAACAAGLETAACVPDGAAVPAARVAGWVAAWVGACVAAWVAAVLLLPLLPPTRAAAA